MLTFMIRRLFDHYSEQEFMPQLAYSGRLSTVLYHTIPDTDYVFFCGNMIAQTVAVRSMHVTTSTLSPDMTWEGGREKASKMAGVVYKLGKMEHFDMS